MSEPVIQLSFSQLNEFARTAGRAGGELALQHLSEQHGHVLQIVERSGAHKAVLSTNEAAHYAGVTSGTIRKWIRDGMKATNIGGRAGFQIRKADIDDWRTKSSAPRA